jgi:SAM-dependent methyltransferase
MNVIIDKVVQVSSETGSAPFYDRTAEYVAVLLPSAWVGLGPALAEALADVDTSPGPVVDVGAGTGLGTSLLARALPDAEIVAVEPHSGLRIALLARIAEDKDLSARVTVVTDGILSAQLPEQISALIAINVVGHLTPEGRSSLWALLADRLAPGGRAILNLSPPTTPESVPATPMAEVTMGRRRYLGTAAAEPDGADAVTWTMSYRVVEEGAVVAELSAEDRWYVFTPETLAAEVGVHGLRVTAGAAEHGLQVITRF